MDAPPIWDSPGTLAAWSFVVTSRHPPSQVTLLRSLINLPFTPTSIPIPPQCTPSTFYPTRASQLHRCPRSRRSHHHHPHGSSHGQRRPGALSTHRPDVLGPRADQRHGPRPACLVPWAPVQAERSQPLEAQRQRRPDASIDNRRQDRRNRSHPASPPTGERARDPPRLDIEQLLLVAGI